MTRQHRRTHWLVWLVLAPLVVVGIVTALVVRPAPTPAEPASPSLHIDGGAR